MNKCRFAKNLNSYLDDQLTDERKLEFEQHLKQCRSCEEELTQLKLLSKRLQDWQAPLLGAGFDSAVKNQIVREELERGEVKMKKKNWAVLVPSGVLAGILVFLVVGHTVVKQGMPGKLSHNDRVFTGEPYEPYYLAGDFKKEKELAENLVAISPRSGNQAVYGGSSARQTRSDYYSEGASLGVVDDSRSRAFAKGITGNEEFGYKDKSDLNRKTEMDYAFSRGVAPAESAPGIDGPVIVVSPTLPATGESEKIIRSAQIRLEVEDGKATYKKAFFICQDLGGYLASSNFYKDNSGREIGQVLMRIPKDKFIIALDKLAELGKVVSSSTNSQDVSQDYANLKSQLDATMVVYNKMMEALQKKQVSIDQAARLESELTPVLAKVQGLKNQIDALNNAVSFTSISLEFYEAQVSSKVLSESRNAIQENMLKAKINSVRYFAELIPSAVPVVAGIVLLVVGLLLLKMLISHLFKRG